MPARTEDEDDDDDSFSCFDFGFGLALGLPGLLAVKYVTSPAIPGTHSSSPGSILGALLSRSAAIPSFLLPVFPVGADAAECDRVMRNPPSPDALFFSSLPNSLSESSLRSDAKLPILSFIFLGFIFSVLSSGGGERPFRDNFSFLGGGLRPGWATIPSRSIRATSSSIFSATSTALLHPICFAHSAAVAAMLEGLHSALPPGAQDRNAPAKRFISFSSSL
mmetsp:Transcript_31261/g.91555  ORF Transcript_31261/g.91555 Transcript_31261/m.91555 type:complete len:221 (+) Transcript_31261:166-828(+)